MVVFKLIVLHQTNEKMLGTMVPLMQVSVENALLFFFFFLSMIMHECHEQFQIFFDIIFFPQIRCFFVFVCLFVCFLF